MKKIFLLLIFFGHFLSSFGQFSGGGGSITASQPLTYGRVNAINDLANVTYTNANNGVKIPFSNIIYNSGISFSGTDVMIPSVTGRYHVTGLMQASSNEFAGNGYFVIMQNGVFVARQFFDMMEAAGVNHCPISIDVDLVAGQGVELRYQPSITSDAVVWQVGSFFQLSQKPTGVAVVVDAVAEGSSNTTITTAQTTSSSTFVDVAGGSIPLTSAGTWSITYNISTQTSGQEIHYFRVVNSAGVEVPNSIAYNQGFTASARFSTSMTIPDVITTGAETYRLQWRVNQGTGTIRNLTGAGVENTNSTITWRKTAGQLPASTFVGANGTVAGTVGFVPAPAATDNVKFLKGDGTWGAVTASLTSGQNLGIVNMSVTSSASFVDIPGSSFTLPTAGTYMVTYDIQGTNTGLANLWGDIRMTNSANVVVAGSYSSLIDKSSQSEIQSVSKTFLVTPTASTTYKLQYATQGGSFTIYNNALLNGGGNSNITWIKVN